MPFFSVIIPTYNRSEDLKRSLESVLLQSFTDFEVIVVDDGSTDDTAQVVRSFSDERVRYIYQDNSERSAARNNGIRNASGKYICLLDSDDIYYPEHLDTLYQQIIEDDAPVAVYKTMMNYDAKSRPDDFSYAYTGSDRESTMRYVWANGSQLISLCFHRDIGQQVLFPEPFFWFEDVHWLMRVVSQYPLRQISAHTTRYFNKSTINKLKTNYEKYLNNNEACIRDLEMLHGDELKKILGANCFNIKVVELYLGFVVAGAIESKQFSLAKQYLAKAMDTCITPKLAAKYAYYYLKLLKASLS